MIAPGLPRIAQAYNITNPTVAALTLSIFVLGYVSECAVITLISFSTNVELGNRPAFYQPTF